MADLSPNTPIGPDAVIVRVGTEGPCLKGRGRVSLWPVIHVVFSRDSQEGMELLAKKAWPYPRNIFIRWQDTETADKPGQKKRWLALYEPGHEKLPWVRYRCPQEDRERFETLRRMWLNWYLRIEIQGFGHRDFLVSIHTGAVEPTDFLEDDQKGVPAGALKYDKAGFIEEMSKHNRRELATQRMLAILKDHNERNERLGKISDEVLHEVAIRHADMLEQLGGPMPWTIEKERPPSYYRIDKNDHKAIIERYLAVLASSRTYRENFKKRPHSLYKDLEPDEYVVFRMQQFEMAMRRAHIFELTYEAYANIFRSADIYTTETVAGMKHYGTELPDAGIPEEEKQEHEKLISEAGKQAPFPDKLPFESCWLAIGRGRLGLTEHQAACRGINPGLQCRVVGILITDGGLCLEVVESHDPTLDHTTFQYIPHHEPAHWPTQVSVDDYDMKAGDWIFPYSLAPWVVLYTIEAINDHHTTVVNGVSGMSDRLMYERLSKKFSMPKPIPAPFYTVTMRDITIKLAARRINRKNKFRWSYSHRFDRRGCEAMNVERGPLPMPDDIKQLLQRRSGYRVWDTASPIDDEEIIAKLRTRRIMPKSHLEWMAIKTWWRDGSIVGDASLPYVPSTRKPTKGVIGYKDQPGTKSSVETEFPTDDMPP